MPKSFRAMLRDQSGATAIEYGLIGGSVALVIIGAATLVGGDLATFFQTLADAL